MHENVLAYIDPGAGSILLQFLIGSLVGAGFFFRCRLVKLFGIFRRGNREAASQPTPPVGQSPAE